MMTNCQTEFQAQYQENPHIEVLYEKGIIADKALSIGIVLKRLCLQRTGAIWEILMQITYYYQSNIIRGQS